MASHIIEAIISSKEILIQQRLKHKAVASMLYATKGSKEILIQQRLKLCVTLIFDAEA